jgi:amino acid adenylation domain-containing protein
MTPTESTSKPRKFSCVLMGSGTLPIRCAEALASRGHSIQGVISSDPQLRLWAEEKQIARLDDPGDLGELARHPFDYLFNIVNERLLPDEILKLPSAGAINYHDALLPAYAGGHATSWAILHGEAIHGVTWHLMTTEVDAGDILKQREIPIAARETALTLNAKCYEAALDSFSELIEDLACGRLSPQKQNLEKRTFFPRDQRPPAGCAISWAESAKDIDALVRALDFGHYPNPVGLPKIAVGANFVGVTGTEIRGTMSQAPPGTVTEIVSSEIKVSTATHEIALRHFVTLDGEPLTPAECASRFGLAKGYRFPEIAPERAARISALDVLCAKNEGYWLKKLATLRALAIPFAGPRPGSGQSGGGRERLPMRLPEQVVSFLKQSEPEGRASDLLVAACSAWLAGVADVDSFDIGFSDWETRAELAGLEELFAPLVPLRFVVNRALSFQDYSPSARKELASVRRRKTYLRDMVARYPDLRPLRGQKEFFPLTIQQVRSLDDCQSAPAIDLTLVIPEERAECLWIYHPQVLDRDHVTRIADGLTSFLLGVAAGPQRPIAELPLIGEGERHRLLYEWNETRTDYSKNLCLHHLIEKQVDRSPESVALVYEQRSLTYREVNARGNQVAHLLRARGVGPDVCVGLCMERSIEMILALLGILKAGGAYMPLDPSYPRERLAFMVEDSALPVLLTERRLMNVLPHHGASVICLDPNWWTVSGESAENPAVDVGPDNLAYVLYTSGSTGRPKGAQVEHRGLTNLVETQSRVCDIRPGDRVLQFCSLSFDPSIFEIGAAFHTGATLVVASQSSLAPGPALAELFRRQGVTTIVLPPSVLSPLPDEDFPALRTLVVGAEPVTAEFVRRWAAGRRIFNIYGATEATVFSTIAECYADGAKPAIGRPIANNRVYLLDSRLQPVPVGAPGELYIGGVGVARGYLNRPELTAERFIPDPFSDEPSARLYRTGDMARYLPDGTIDFLGRVDHQVKVRGHRIELEEIEAVLSQHTSIRECAVAAREDAPGDRRLVAYVVPDHAPAPSASELRGFLKNRLPDYMVPGIFVPMDALPLLPSGKVDRRALPPPDPGRMERSEAPVAPRDSVEFRLTKIWEDTLGVRPIGITDDFFELGGHSLLAVTMFARVQKTFGRKLPLTALFEAPTIAKLGDVIRRQEPAFPWLVEIQPGGSAAPLFCIRAGLEFRDIARELGPGQPVYGVLDGDLLERQGAFTLDQATDEYVRRVRAVQSEGPYFLSGHCLGALLAFRVAQALQAQGQTVPFLALFDAVGPGYRPRLSRRKEFVLFNAAKIPFHLQSLWRLEGRKKLLYIKKRLRNLFKVSIPANTRRAGVALFRMFGRPLPPWLRMERLRQLAQDSPSGVYAGRITLFRAKGPTGGSHDPALGWARFAAQGVEVHEMPGDHQDMYKPPNVQIMARQLRDCLAEAQSKAGPRNSRYTDG